VGRSDAGTPAIAVLMLRAAVRACACYPPSARTSARCAVSPSNAPRAGKFARGPRASKGSGPWLRRGWVRR